MHGSQISLNRSNEPISNENLESAKRKQASFCFSVIQREAQYYIKLAQLQK